MKKFYKYVPLAALGAIPLLSIADPLEQSASLPLTYEFDSNPGLRATNAQSVSRLRFSPQYDLSLNQDADRYTAFVGANIENSSNQAVSKDRRDPRLGFGWTRNFPVSALNVNGRYDETSSRTSEFEQNGIVTNDVTRKTSSLSAGWTSKFTDRLNYSLNTGATKVEHDRVSAGLSNYTNTTMGAGLGYELTPSDEATLNYSHSHYSPSSTSSSPSTNGSSTSQTVMLGYKRRVTEDFDWSVRAGGVSISRDSGSSSDWQGGFALNFTGIRSNLTLDLGRTTAPSGATGGFVTSDQLRANYGYAYDEKTRLSLDTTLVKQAAQTVAGGSSSLSIGAGVTRELSQFWQLSFRAQRRQVDRDVGGSADSNLVSATLIYTHPSF